VQQTIKAEVSFLIYNLEKIRYANRKICKLAAIPFVHATLIIMTTSVPLLMADVIETPLKG
jgi:hypothetical protein